MTVMFIEDQGDGSVLSDYNTVQRWGTEGVGV